jgi:primosomal protein N' (replication factor Y)
VQYAARHDFVGFYEKELRFRSWMHYPPYSALANVLVRSDKLDDALQWSGLLGKWFDGTRHEGVRVLGPAAAPILKLKRDYRYHFVLKSPSRQKLNATLRAMLAFAAQQKIPRTQVIVDVDALWLMFPCSSLSLINAMPWGLAIPLTTSVMTPVSKFRLPTELGVAA